MTYTLSWVVKGAYYDNVEKFLKVAPPYMRTSDMHRLHVGMLTLRTIPFESIHMLECFKEDWKDQVCFFQPRVYSEWMELCPRDKPPRLYVVEHISTRPFTNPPFCIQALCDIKGWMVKQRYIQDT